MELTKRQLEEKQLRAAPLCLYKEEVVPGGNVSFQYERFRWERVALPCGLLVTVLLWMQWQGVVGLMSYWWGLPAWLIVGYCTFVLMLPVTSVEEVYIHTLTMHRRCRFRVIRWLFDSSYFAHHVGHHFLTAPATDTGRDSFPIKKWHQVKFSTFPVYILAIFWPAHGIPAWLVFVKWFDWGIWGWAIVLGVLASITARFARYETVHARQHEPDELRQSHYTNDKHGQMMKREDIHHRVHHHFPMHNLEVSMWWFMGRYSFIGGMLTGTYIKMPSESLSDFEIADFLKKRGVQYDYVNPKAPLAWLTHALRWLFVSDDHPMFRQKCAVSTNPPK